MTETTVLAANVIPLSNRMSMGAPNAAPTAPDERYMRLVGAGEWRRLPEHVQKRFSRKLSAGQTIVYCGEVVHCALSRLGRLVAQLARLVGGPLPYTADATGSSIVAVTESPELGGQIWTRQYSRPGRFPQVIHSAKRFGGPTGLEEFLGLGLAMRLSAHVETERGTATLVFRSAGYAVHVLGRTIALPHWLTPGRCEVRHRAETDRRFSFTLTLDHPLAGRLLHQVAFYEEAGS